MGDITINLRRTTFTDRTTIGELYMPDGLFFCHTLEDVIRPYKIPGKTAIPSGKYEVVCSWSNRYQRIMPRLLNVPFYQGILIHWGNTEAHTEGCILVGRRKAENVVYESRLAFDELFPILRKFTEKGKLFIEIEGGYPADQWEKEAV